MGLEKTRDKPDFLRQQPDGGQNRLAARVVGQALFLRHHRVASMSGITPNRPSGTTPPARWCQWVHDSIFSFLRVGQVRGAKVSSTTGGVFVEPLDLGGTTGSRVRQYVLTDAS